MDSAAPAMLRWWHGQTLAPSLTHFHCASTTAQHPARTAARPPAQRGGLAAPGTRGQQLHVRWQLWEQRNKIILIISIVVQGHISSAQGYGVRCPGSPHTQPPGRARSRPSHSPR